MRRMGIFIGIIIFCVFMGMRAPASVQASDRYVSSYDVDDNMPVKVGSTVFRSRLQQNGSDAGNNIEIEKDGVTIAVLTDTYGQFTTNGKNIYFAKHKKQIDEDTWKNVIYCYDIKTGRSRRITSGKNYVVMGCSGKYLYCGADSSAGIDGAKLYVVNVNTKKKRYLTGQVSDIVVSGAKVLANPFSSELWNYPIYIFNENGSGKKEVMTDVWV